MKIKDKTTLYSDFLGQMRDELQHLIDIELTNDDDLNVDKMQAKWNACVNCCHKWIEIAESTLYNPYLKKKFQKESKQELLNKCAVVISEVNALSCKNSKAKVKKKILLEELSDRVEYIRSNY